MNRDNYAYLFEESNIGFDNSLKNLFHKWMY